MVESLNVSDAALCMRPANERWRYIVTSPPIGRAHKQNYPCEFPMAKILNLWKLALQYVQILPKLLIEFGKTS